MAEPRTGGSRPDRALGDTVSRMVLVTGLDLSQTSTGIARAWVDLDNPANLGTYTTTVGSTGAAGDTLHQRHRRLVSHRNRIRGTSANPTCCSSRAVLRQPHQRGVVDIAGLRWLVLHSVPSTLDVGTWWRCRRPKARCGPPPAGNRPQGGEGHQVRGPPAHRGPVRLAVRRAELARRRPRHRGRRGPGHARPGPPRLPLRPPLDDDRRRALEGASRPAGMETAGGLPTATSTTRHQQ